MGKPTFDLPYCGFSLVFGLVWVFNTVGQMKVSNPEYIGV